MYPRIDGKDFPAVYGPLIELGQRGFYRLVAWITPDPAVQLFWFKSVAALADLGIIAAVLLLLRARGAPLQRVLIYAWCPLPVFEFWATGHNDSVVILLVMLATAFAAGNRGTAAAFWLSLAAMAKFGRPCCFRLLRDIGGVGSWRAAGSWPRRLPSCSCRIGRI